MRTKSHPPLLSTFERICWGAILTPTVMSRNSDWSRSPVSESSHALRILRARFPEPSEHFGTPDEPEPGDPYVSYGLLAEEALQRRDDQAFLDHVFAFINELADSGDHLLEDLLFLSVLESLAQNPEFAASLYPKITVKAQKGLRLIERRYYGRSR